MSPPRVPDRRKRVVLLLGLAASVPVLTCPALAVFPGGLGGNLAGTLRASTDP